MELNCDTCWLPPGAGNQQKRDVCFHIHASQALLSKEAWKGVPPKPVKVWRVHIWSDCLSWWHLLFSSSTVICHLWRGKGAGWVTNVCFPSATHLPASWSTVKQTEDAGWDPAGVENTRVLTCDSKGSNGVGVQPCCFAASHLAC